MNVLTGMALFLLLLLSFGTAQAQGSPSLEDIMNMSVSGYVNIDYSKAENFKTDAESYGKVFGQTLNKELDRSIADCQTNKSLLETQHRPVAVLSDNLRKILNSLREGKQFDDYKLISSFMVKYAGNREDLYFHQDYRHDYSNCLVWSSRNDPQCNLWKKRFFMAESTPLMGSVNGAKYRNGKGAGAACGRLVHDLLPRAYTPKVRALYDRYVSRSCQKLSTLKSCLDAEMQIDERNRHSGMPSAPVKGEMNSTFDEFQTLEMIKR